MSTVLFVGHLSVICNESDLYEAFSQIGPIECIKLMRTRKKASLGYAFVTMQTIEDATKAISALDGQLLCGREMKIGFGTQGNSNMNSNSGQTDHFPDNSMGSQYVDKVQAPLHMNSLLLRFSSSSHSRNFLNDLNRNSDNSIPDPNPDSNPDSGCNPSVGLPLQESTISDMYNSLFGAETVVDVNIRRLYNENNSNGTANEVSSGNGVDTRKGYGFIHFKDLASCNYALRHFRSILRGGIYYYLELSKNMIKQVGVEAALEFINMPPGNVIYIHEDGKIETKSDVYMDSNKNSYSHASDHDLSASLANLSKLSNNSSNSNLSGIASSNSSCSNNSAKWGMNLTFKSSHRQKDGADFQGAVLSKNVPNFNGKNSNFDANALHNRLGGDSKTASHLSCADFEKFLSMIPPKPNNVQPSIGGGGSLGNHSNFNMSQNRIATNQYVPAVALGKFNPNIRSNLDRQVSGFAHDGGNGNVLVNAPRNQNRNASYSNSIAQSRPEHEHFNLDGNQQYTGNKYENMQPVSSSPNDRSVVYGHPYRPVVSTQISHRNQSSDTDIYNGYFASISSNGTAQPMLQPPPPPLHNRGYHGSGERGGVPTRPVHVQRNNQMMQVNWDTPQMHQSNSFNQGPVISHAVVYNNQPEPSILSRRANRDVFFENQAQPSNHIPQINRGAGHKVQTQSISQRQAGDVSCNNQVQPVNHGLLLSRLSPTTKSAFPPTSVSTSNYYNTVSISNAKRTQETVMQGVWDSLPSDSSNTMPSSDLHKCRSNMEVENLMSSNEYSLSMNGSPGLHSVADVELGSNDSTRGMH